MRKVIVLILSMVLSLIFIFAYSNQISIAEPSEDTLYVGGSGPGNYSSIRKAIEEAESEDTIFVYEGTYSETISITKSIHITGEHKDSTIIDGENKGNVIEIKAQEVTFSSLTVQNSKKPTKEKEEYAGILLNEDMITLSNCNILHCTYAILIKSSNQNTIEQCYLNDNYGGISIQSSNENTVKQCEITNSSEYYAIALTSSSNNRVEFCNIHHNPVLGIVFSQSTDNVIHHNEFRSNSYAMRFFQTETNSCRNNTIYQNNFIDNLVIDNCNNDWNYSSKGNYWSDYSGSDSNQDGIGDDAFLIPGGVNKDFFPLMNMVIIETNESESDNSESDDSSENSPPTASFSFSPQNPFIGETIFFTDTSIDQDGIIESWYWDFGDENTSLIQHPQHSFFKNGSYNITLQVTDDNGSTDEYTKSIIIKTNGSNESIAIHHPQNDDVLHGSVHIYGNATFDSFERIEVQVDDRQWNAATGIDPWNYSLNTTQYENGLHTIHVRGILKNGEYVLSSIQVAFENSDRNESDNNNDLKNDNETSNTSVTNGENNNSNEKNISDSDNILFFIIVVIIGIIGIGIILFIARI